MNDNIEMTYSLSEPDDKGFSWGKALTTVQTSDEKQEFEVLFRINGEFRNDGLEWALNLMMNDISQIQNINIHPTLIMQLTLILAGAELVFHRDNPKNKPEFKFHGVGFHYNLLLDSFAKLTRNESDSMKPSRQFVGATLKGLWYKHVDDASMSGMATNILNEMNKGDWLIKSFTERFGPFDGTKTFGDEHNSFLVNQLTVASQQRRAARKDMTGEWIIYQKEDDKLHLLTLASHQEDDTRILQRIKP